MLDISRRKLLVGLGTLGAVATAVGVMPRLVAGPLVVTRTDLGLLPSVDGAGNWFDAYVTEFKWNGKVAHCFVDKTLMDLFPDADRGRTAEDRAFIEGIAFLEGRDVADLQILEAV